jgi:anti-sigma factor RsiW
MALDEHPSNLDALVDHEGSAETLQATAAHVASCALCQAEIELRRKVSAAMRQHMTYYAAPAALKERIHAIPAHAAATDGGRRGSVANIRPPRVFRRSAAQAPRTLRSWTAMAASIALAAIVSAGGTHFVDRRIAATDQVADEVVSSHIRSLVGAHLYDVQSTDQHTVKPWFDGKLDFSPPVQDLATTGFPLVGGRLDYLGHQEVAALIYRRRQHFINLFVWPTDAPDISVSAAPTEQGYNVLHWTCRRMTFWAVSDVTASDLNEFADRFRAKAG